MQSYLVFRRCFSVLFVLLLALASSASAQTGTTSIHGTVTDKTGASSPEPSSNYPTPPLALNA